MTLANSSWGSTRALAAVYAGFVVLIAVGFASSMSGKGGNHQWFLFPLLLCLVPMGGMLHKERAWLLGMDLVSQRRHARSFVFAVQVPMYCVTGGVCAVARGGAPDIWVHVALMAGIIVFRLGTKGWDELVRRAGWRSLLARTPVYLLAIALLFSPIAGAGWALVAAGLGVAAGFLGMEIETRLIQEKDLLDEMRRGADSA